MSSSFYFTPLSSVNLTLRITNKQGIMIPVYFQA